MKKESRFGNPYLIIPKEKDHNIETIIKYLKFVPQKPHHIILLTECLSLLHHHDHVW